MVTKRKVLCSRIVKETQEKGKVYATHHAK